MRQSGEQECCSLLTQKLDNDSKTIETMLNKVMSRMLTIHPRLQKSQIAVSSNNVKNEYLNYFQITSEHLNGKGLFK